ncbi:hypothetical protein [Enterovibrio norvegicus]|uniref:hypothetical protein n=1 Tax=Enterovibrio norvegicus TaxID=188144 RepID=UPI0024B13A6B|nr:hypothetical protein [Enterovibrio norvegicus]
MTMLTSITPNWFRQFAKSFTRSRDLRQEHYRSQISSLRTLLWMLHEHNSRFVLAPQSPKASEARSDIYKHCLKMQRECAAPQRPLFRVLNSRMEDALAALPNQSKAAWYAIHVRASDHLVYIIDEVTRAYFSENMADTSYEEYQAFWQIWIDTKEAQLRFEQATMRFSEGKTAAWQSVNLQSRILQKRMHQLSLMTSSEASMAFERIDSRFDSIIHAEDGQIPAESLTKISTDLSVVLLHLFDQELSIRTAATNEYKVTRVALASQ